MDQFFQYLNKISPISKNSEEELRKILQIKSYTAKTKIWDIGEIPTEIGFLKTGIVRAYITSPNGYEYNKSIFTESDFIAPFYGIIRNEPSIYSIESLTDCTVIQCDYATYMELVKNHKDVGKLHRKNLEQFYMNVSCRNIDFLTLNATERYLKLLKKNPKINILVSQKQIANHLAITTVQLSRIKKKLVKT